MYDPVLGRFLSSDLLVSDPENTQSYNRYTYCMNNPLKYVDLSGLFPIRRKDGTWYDQNIEYPYDRDEMEPWEVDMWFEINGFDPNLYNHDMTDCNVVFEIGEENKYAVKYYGYEYGSTDVLIENLNTGKKIQFNTLLPHMIRYHHFFESPNVSHRLDPKDVIEIFNLQEGIDYSPKYVTKYYWSIDMSSSHLEDYIKELKNNIIEQSATRICLNKYETDIDT